MTSYQSQSSSHAHVGDHFPSARISPPSVDSYANSKHAHHQLPAQQEQHTYQSYPNSAVPQISLMPSAAAYRGPRSMPEQQPQQHIQQYPASSGGEQYPQHARRDSVMSAPETSHYSPVSPQRHGAEEQVGLEYHQMQPYDQGIDTWFYDENYFAYNQHAWQSNSA
ncbi:hypothetical protein V5O48_017056 [Marasmius crinis-equi]|uniref:Uncharacterized protein n=1 Tax=Marasmius crinis-equi TaxID=585013 RepID=A0ABR3EQ17_9AGAR